MNLPVIVLVQIVDAAPPIEALRLEDGRRAATVRSLCTMLDVARNGQMERIRGSRNLSSALFTVTVLTAGGPQATDVLLDWAVPIWASGLHTSRLPERKQALALTLQQQAFAAIQQAFTQPENNTAPSPPPSQPAIPQSVWEEKPTAGEYLDAELADIRREFRTGQRELRQELRNKLAMVEYDQHSQALRIAALEGRDASSAKGLSGERLKYIYQQTDEIRQRHRHSIAEMLAALAAHFHVADIYDLPDEDWPAVLIWFESLLED